MSDIIDELFKGVSTLDLANLFWDPSDVGAMKSYKWDTFIKSIKDDIALLSPTSKQQLETNIRNAKASYDGEYMPVESYIKPDDFNKLVFGRLVILRQMSEIKKLEGDRGEIKKILLSKNDDDDDVGKLQMLDEYINDIMDEREKVISYYKHKISKYIPSSASSHHSNENMLRSLAKYIGVMFSESQPDTQDASQSKTFGCSPYHEVDKRANRAVESIFPVIDMTRYIHVS